MLFHRLLASQNSMPFQPFITTPAEDGELLFEFDMIVASSFEDSGGTGVHRGTQWQIATDPDFINIVGDTSQQNNYLTEIDVGSLNTSMLSDYYVRVRYFDFEETSRWSTEVLFSTNIFEEPVLDWADDIFDSLMFGF